MADNYSFDEALHWQDQLNLPAELEAPPPTAERLPGQSSDLRNIFIFLYDLFLHAGWAPGNHLITALVYSMYDATAELRDKSAYKGVIQRRILDGLMDGFPGLAGHPVCTIRRSLR